MTICTPKAASDAATLTFKELMDRNKLPDQGSLDDVSPEWTPLEATVGRAASGGPKNFAYLGTYLACDAPSWEALSWRVHHEVVALPIHVDGEIYQVLHVTNIVDCLDMDRSEVMRHPATGAVMEVMTPAFLEAKSAGHHLFRVPERPADTYATDAFRKLIADLHLTGLNFHPPASPLVSIAKLIAQAFAPKPD